MFGELQESETGQLFLTGQVTPAETIATKHQSLIVLLKRATS